MEGDEHWGTSGSPRDRISARRVEAEVGRRALFLTVEAPEPAGSDHGHDEWLQPCLHHEGEAVPTETMIEESTVFVFARSVANGGMRFDLGEAVIENVMMVGPDAVEQMLDVGADLQVELEGLEWAD